jgi:nucleoside-diphosphate-sugar epimerase
VDELHPVNPPDANGVSKWAGEQYWMLENRVLGRPVVSLRLTNCYGPRLRIADARQTFLGIWIRRLLENEPFEVWGGAQLRDLAYVDDVTRAFLMAAEQAARPGVSGQVFNLGGAPPVSLAQLAGLAIAAHGGQGSFTTREFPPSAPRSTSAAITRTTTPSAPPPAGRRWSRWRKACAAPWTGTGTACPTTPPGMSPQPHPGHNSAPPFCLAARTPS